MSVIEQARRDWTNVGAEVVERIGGRDAASSEAESLEWQSVPIGRPLTVGFMPGEAIKAAISELAIPKVSAIAIGSLERPGATGDDDGWYPGFYGIEGNYRNCVVRVYIIDGGESLIPIFADVWEIDETDDPALTALRQAGARARARGEEPIVDMPTAAEANARVAELGRRKAYR